MDPDRYLELASAIEAQVGQVIVGQRSLVRTVLLCLLCEGHALLEGVPGVGKTVLLRTLADAVDLDFGRIQFTPDLMPADIVGTQVLQEDDRGQRSFSFRAGPVFANLVLADEVNRATPKTQSALLEAMAERRVTTSGRTRDLPRPFLVMATQNPVEMEGTYPLPEAQLDRFLLKASVPFPSADELVTVLERTTGADEGRARAVADADQLRAMAALTRRVPAPSHVTRYAAELVLASHPDTEAAPEAVRRYVRFGASPRGAQALLLAAKATALLDGRPSASVPDVVAVAGPALGHRLVLGYEAAADGVTPEDLVGQVVAAVPEPADRVKGSG